MSRMLKGYQSRYRRLLLQLRARRVEQGLIWFTDQVRRSSRREGIPLAESARRLCQRLAGRAAVARFSHAPIASFVCDAGLGGLARWLRAAGYEAVWRPDIDDHDLVQEAVRLGATLLTTDSMLMERRLVREGTVPALWLPPAFPACDQFLALFRDLRLPLKASRCMACGGELRREEKTELGSRIPPKTYRWLDEYFVCLRCGKIFWHGTHWQRIQKNLEAIAGQAR